jgi:lactate permease
MLINWILALSPILVILLLMLRFRWGAAKAGPVGWFVAMIVAWTRFGAGLELLALSQTKALLLTMDVLLIIWSAFLLYRVADEAGAIGILTDALPKLTSDRGMQAIIIGWAFASFLQGVGGFGVPTAVTAPLLVGLGFTPLTAVVVPSIGHAWSVTFGSLASSFQALMAATGIPGEMLAPVAALMLGFVGIGCGFMVVHASDGWSAVRRLFIPVLALGITMGVVQYVIAINRFWHMAGFGAGMAGLGVGLFIARQLQQNSGGKTKIDIDGKRVFLAISGYIALIVITLIIQLVEPVREVLSQFVIRVPFPEMTTSMGYSTPAGDGRVIYLFRHGGAILTYASLVAYLIYRRTGMYKPGATRIILIGTVRRVVSSSLGIAAMVAMAVVMAHAGMTDTLARGLAEGVGALFPLISPWIGALGAFVTGSNTNSNVVFSMLQLRTSELLGYKAGTILGAQTTGGAVGSVVAPTKIIVGASTAGMAGNESGILRVLLGYTGVLLLIISVGVWLAITVGGG